MHVSRDIRINTQDQVMINILEGEGEAELYILSCLGMTHESVLTCMAWDPQPAESLAAPTEIVGHFIS